MNHFKESSYANLMFRNGTLLTTTATILPYHTPNERPGTDHVTSGPLRGLKKTAPNGKNRQTDKRLDMATLGLNRPSGANSVKTNMKLNLSSRKNNFNEENQEHVYKCI